MSFEALISLILFLLFVVVPLFGNKKKPDESGKPGSKPRQVPGQQPRTRSAQQPQQQQTAQASPSDSGRGDSWEDKLREARRRIEEAMGETVMEMPGHQTPRAQTETAPVARPAKPLVSRSATTISGKTVGGPQRTLPQAQTRTAAPVSMNRERESGERTSQLRKTADSTEPQVTRPDGRPTYTGRRRRTGASGLFTTESLQNGLIWHQVLSEPPHRRGRRRTSRLRSP